MTEHKFTDEEVIKALECCSQPYCNNNDCPLNEHTINTKDCITKLSTNALDLINRQRAEIDDLTKDTIPKLKYGLERANKYGVELEKSLANAKAEAIEDFAERLKEKHRRITDYDEAGFGCQIFIVEEDYIDRLVKEMTEGKPCTEDADCSICEYCYHDGGYNECAVEGVKP